MGQHTKMRVLSRRWQAHALRVEEGEMVKRGNGKMEKRKAKESVPNLLFLFVVSPLAGSPNPTWALPTLSGV